MVRRKLAIGRFDVLCKFHDPATSTSQPHLVTAIVCKVPAHHYLCIPDHESQFTLSPILNRVEKSIGLGIMFVQRSAVALARRTPVSAIARRPFMSAVPFYGMTPIIASSWSMPSDCALLCSMSILISHFVFRLSRREIFNAFGLGDLPNGTRLLILLIAEKKTPTTPAPQQASGKYLSFDGSFLYSIAVYCCVAETFR
jgi:hypothetical protein